MDFKLVAIIVIVGMWIVGLLLGQGNGNNYDDETPTPRPIDKILETAKPDYISGYDDDPFGDAGPDYESEDGINTP
jgi:hypothetical protein